MSQQLNRILIQQDANEVLDYLVDWSGQLDTADAITGTPAWTVAPVTVPPLAATIPTNTSTTTRVWVSGGLAGTSYTVEVTFSTSGGRTFQGHLLVASI